VISTLSGPGYTAATRRYHGLPAAGPRRAGSSDRCPDRSADL